MSEINSVNGIMMNRRNRIFDLRGFSILYFLYLVILFTRISLAVFLIKKE